MPNPVPIAIDLVRKNMAPNDNSQTIVNEMKKNYKKLEDITLDIKNHGLDEYLELDNTGRYDLYKCEGCDGPMHWAINSKSRNGNKSIERPKSDLVKKVEAMEKDNVAIGKAINIQSICM